MVPAPEDVLDSEQHEARDAAAAFRDDARLARIRLERELAGGAETVDPGQRVVVRSERVEEVVADPSSRTGAPHANSTTSVRLSPSAAPGRTDPAPASQRRPWATSATFSRTTASSRSRATASPARAARISCATAGGSTAGHNVRV